MRQVEDAWAVGDAVVQVADAGRAVPVVGEVAAGQADAPEVAPGTAVAIMTGAPCPPGTEAVVKVEDTRREGDRVFLPPDVVTGQHFGRRESSLTMEEAASKGILGGFLKAVMVGSDQEIWQLADELNQQAIAHLIPRHIKNGVDERFVDGSDLT